METVKVDLGKTLQFAKDMEEKLERLQSLQTEINNLYSEHGFATQCVIEFTEP